MCLGLGLLGVGIAAMVLADLGLGPWDVLHQGVADRTGIPLGTVTIVVGALVMLAWIPLREPPGVGTLLNLVLVGVVVDAVLASVEPPGAVTVRVAGAVVGPVLMGIGSALYIGGGLGPGPRDGLMTAIVRRGRSVQVVRTALELAAMGAGFALGGTVGVATAWQAVSIGPLIHLLLPHLTFDREPQPTAFEVE